MRIDIPSDIKKILKTDENSNWKWARNKTHADSHKHTRPEPMIDLSIIIHWQSLWLNRFDQTKSKFWRRPDSLVWRRRRDWISSARLANNISPFWHSVYIIYKVVTKVYTLPSWHKRNEDFYDVCTGRVPLYDTQWTWRWLLSSTDVWRLQKKNRVKINVAWQFVPTYATKRVVRNFQS